uniref:Interferon-induced protein 44 n=1 Tax=Castor canadensis TaxID=51338 RepID=A0A8B7WE07_CASCN|nr:interferon-induced protein 44-like [Castor canadensis]
MQLRGGYPAVCGSRRGCGLAQPEEQRAEKNGAAALQTLWGGDLAGRLFFYYVRKSLLATIRSYKPYRDLVHQSRILLLGPVGAGKSSFCNLVKSVFQGYVTHQALVGSNTTGMSVEYRTYSIKDGNDGNSLPFVLCDSLGLSEKGGLCKEDRVYILKGHTPDRYHFDSTKPITPKHGNYIHCPFLKDRIHCVAFMFDANSVEQLSHEMVAKIRRIRREVIKCGVVHVALLTHVDSINLIAKDDFIDIYSYVPVKCKIQAVHRKLGFALSDILVVSNYVSEWELDPVKDILILSALRQMLLATDDFLEDLPLEQVMELPEMSASITRNSELMIFILLKRYKLPCFLVEVP